MVVLTGVEEVVEDAVLLAQRWAELGTEQQRGSQRRASARLASLVSDPRGLELAVRFIDRVIRPEDPEVAAAALGRLGSARSAGFLGPADKALFGIGSKVASLAPSLVVPLARQRLRQLIGHLIVDAGDPALGRHLAAARADGFRLNVNLLGEAVLGEQQAADRAARIAALMGRDDVDYVSIKVSAVVSQISTWDLHGTADRVIERLRPLYEQAAAASPRPFINLDMEEYRDLDLTLEVFERVLALPELSALEAGIVLQAYLPDSVAAAERLTEFARRRTASGGGRIKIRLVKGANLAMEQVEAEIRGWPQAPYPTKAEVDANYVRLLDVLLRPEVCDSLRVGVASHNLFDLALAHLLGKRRGVDGALDVEMLQGMAPAQAAVIRDDIGYANPIILYTPVVAAEDFDAAVSYLVRRLEENAAPENFLHALFDGSPEALSGQEQRFRCAVTASGGVARGPRRTARAVSVGERFAHTPDSDPTVATVRDRAQAASTEATAPPASKTLRNKQAVDAVMRRARTTAPGWSIRSGSDRAAVLRRVAQALADRRFDLIAVMAAEAGKTVGESDPEVSEAVDFARYYADAAASLDDLALAEGLAHEPDRVVLVTPPWNFPVAIPMSGVLAALAAGSAVVLKPAPQTPRCAEVAVAAVREVLEEEGIDPDLVQVVRTGEGKLGRALVSHPDVDTVVLTGSQDSARLFVSLRADRPRGPRVFAETSGKNALIITPSADYDLAVADAVASAFGHAGQKCSAASLLILVGSAATSPRLRRQLTDAVSSVRVGWPTDLGATMGPLIEKPSGKLADALTTLADGERWLVEPRSLDASGRLWSPGLKDRVAAGSVFHLTECFGPVLGIMTAADLDEAIELQNATAFGLTGGLHSLDAAEIEHWTERVEVGNAYVNRTITGAVVGRQPFGGWKGSVVGPGAKAGGPNYVAQLGTWTQVRPPNGHGEIGPRVQEILGAVTPALSRSDRDWLAQAAASDAHARDRYAVGSDPSGLRAESNVFRYLPVGALTVHAGVDATLVDVLRVLLAAECAGVPVEVSTAPAFEIPQAFAEFTHVHGWSQRTDVELADALRSGSLQGRVRVLGSVTGLWDAAANADAATILDAPVVQSGARELLTVLREQTISRTLHRFGHLPPSSPPA